MDTSEVRKIVSGIKSNLFKNANSFSIGMLKSHFKGTGLKFKEHQVYTHGDDVRFIDWKMLAKTSQPYIKTFEEERNIEITILLDCTSGMFMGVDGKSKLEGAIEISCLLYLLAGMTSDYVQTIICTGQEIIRVQKKNGELGIVALVDTLRRKNIIKSDGSVNFEYKADNFDKDYNKKIIQEFYKKKELVILSDFYNFLHGEDLKRLVARKHVHAFRILTPLDYADDFHYSVNIKDFLGNTFGTRNIKLEAKNRNTEDTEIRVKDLFLDKRYLEDFVKEML